MSDIALIQVVGRLTKDAQAEQVNNQPDRLNVKFTVASSYYQYGQQDRPTAFYECRVFMNRKRWDSMGVDLKKGRTVVIWGELRPRTSAGNDGKEKTWLNVEQGDFAFIGPKPEQTSSPGGYQQNTQSVAPPAGGSAPPGYEAPLPDGWTQQTDPSTQRPYYVGPNNQTQWERPQPPAPAAAPPATPPPAGPPSGPPAGGPPGYPI